jgi:hypothetical protein
MLVELEAETKPPADDADANLARRRLRRESKAWRECRAGDGGGAAKKLAAGWEGGS